MYRKKYSIYTAPDLVLLALQATTGGCHIRVGGGEGTVGLDWGQKVVLFSPPNGLSLFQDYSAFVSMLLQSSDSAF